MRALKDWAGIKLALVLTLAIGILIGVALVGIGAVAQTDPATPVASYSTCRHYGENVKNPCWVGNVVVTCGYGAGYCESSSFIHCKLSAELGEKVPVDGNPEKGYIIRHPHKTVTCHGSATILKVYREKGGERTPRVFQAVTVHAAHSFSVTLYGHLVAGSITMSGEGLVVMAHR